MHKTPYVLNLNFFSHYIQKLKALILSHNHQEEDFDGFNQLKNK